MTPKLICPIETVAKSAASAAWAKARHEAIDAGFSVFDAIYLADVAKAAKLTELAPMVAAYNAQHGATAYLPADQRAELRGRNVDTIA